MDYDVYNEADEDGTEVESGDNDLYSEDEEDLEEEEGDPAKED
jgi:hypothetical protein